MRGSSPEEAMRGRSVRATLSAVPASPHGEADARADRYLAVWNGYRRAMGLRWGARLGLVALMVAAVVFHFARYALLPIFWSAVALSAFQLRGPRCPRCSHEFFERKFLPGVEGAECATCGLAFGASEGEGGRPR